MDSLQLEQGGRFFQKRNRNIIVEIDHDIIEFEKEEARQKIRKKVDKGFPTGNDADFGTSME